MPQRDQIHTIVREALLKDGWEITDDPYIISYGERFLFIDLGATFPPPSSSVSSTIIGAHRGTDRIAIEIKDFRGKSAIQTLEQAIGQYVLYRLLLDRVDPGRQMYLAITDVVFDDFFSEPIGALVIEDLPLYLLVVNEARKEIQQWMPLPSIVEQ